MDVASCTFSALDLSRILCAHVVLLQWLIGFIKILLTSYMVLIEETLTCGFTNAIKSQLMERTYGQAQMGKKILPPPMQVTASRRPNKKRRWEHDEPRSHTSLCRRYLLIKCTKCWVQGHNKKRSYRNPPISQV